MQVGLLYTVILNQRQFSPDRFSSPPISDISLGTEDVPLWVLE